MPIVESGSLAKPVRKLAFLNRLFGGLASSPVRIGSNPPERSRCYDCIGLVIGNTASGNSRGTQASDDLCRAVVLEYGGVRFDTLVGVI
jgi:hypothetical protein